MTRYESETIITYNDEEETATVYTCNRGLTKRLDTFCAKSPLFVKGKSDAESATYTVPKKYVTIRFPRAITEEKRAEMARRAKERFGHAEKKEDRDEDAS